MPHLVIDYERLRELRALREEWDEDAYVDGEWRDEAADWGERVMVLVRALADKRIELPDLHTEVRDTNAVLHHNHRDREQHYECSACQAGIPQ